MADFIYPTFENRTPQFTEGFMAWFVGDFNNPYVDYSGRRQPRISFLPSREWQHGQDVAYLVNLHHLKEDDDAE